MWLTIVGWVLGIWLCQQQAQLVLPVWSILTLIALLGAAVWPLRRRIVLLHCLLILLAATTGFGWAQWRAELRLQDQLVAELEGQDVVIRGRVADLPRRTATGLRFEFVADSRPPGVPENLQLSWYLPREGAVPAVPDLRAGETWQLKVRLRRPHGNFNPHGFDYEGWLFERGMRAVGYVRSDAANQRLARRAPGVMPLVQSLRESIRARFERTLPDAEWRGVLSALAVGDQGAISSDQWAMFQKTGVIHLMSISGLHVTLIAGLFAALVNFAWRRVPALCLRLPAQKAAVLAAAISALGYVALAGFGVPAQRTLYMLAVVALAMWLGRSSALWWSLALALLVVLVIDPWAVRAAGFWLSFGAVAALMLAVRSAGAGQHYVMAWLRTQWAVTLLSLPILLGLFQQFSLVSPLANIIAIPLVSAIITPLALLFAVLPLPALAELAHWLLAILMVVLNWLAALPMANWQQAAPPGWMVAIGVMAALWALMPRGTPGRWVGLLALLPLLAATPLRPAPGSMDVRVIDVGQGLAVLVQTAQQDLLFDAGAQFGPDTDSGERIVLPLLRALGVRKLDGMVVSHNDIDHAGGADSVAQGLPLKWMAVSLPADHALRGMAPRVIDCRAGQSWHVDGVSLRFLHPADPLLPRDNDQSCVLHVQSAHGSVLIPGDIEAVAERQVLSRAAGELQADVLLAPHHGSRSSSTAAFIAAVAPQHVVFTAGYRNRFGHPHPAVMQRYQTAGVRMWRSDADGGVLFRFDAHGLSAIAERHERPRYWHGR